MRIIARIDEADVIKRILRHLGLWEAGVRVESARDPPEPPEPVIEPWLDDPFPSLPRRSEAKTGLRQRTGVRAILTTPAAAEPLLMRSHGTERMSSIPILMKRR